MTAELPIRATRSDAEAVATIGRLGRAFGSAAIAELLRGLRALLERVCDSDDHAAQAGEAHRIAGLAGTLGFAALGRQWLAVAEGREPVRAATIEATRDAIATITSIENDVAFIES